MAIQSIKDFYTSFGMSSALIANWTTLSEYKAGKIHLFQETMNRFELIDNSLAFTEIVLEKLACIRMINPLQSKSIKWAIYLTPITLGCLKAQTQKIYPSIAKNLVYLESCLEKAAYATFIIGSIALVRFGHLFIGYSVLSTLAFNQIITSSFVKLRFPLISKVDTVFKIYANPIICAVSIFMGRSYLAIGHALFSLALMAHTSFTKPPTYITQKPQTNIESSSSNKLTLEKWKQFNTQAKETLLTINRKRIPSICLPQMDKNIDAKQLILDILKNLPKKLHKNLISRVNALPEQPKTQTFEEANSVATKYLDTLLSFTKEHSDPIWDTLLQQSCLALQQLNNKPKEQLLGIKELLFGNEGQCQVAQQRNLISGFLTLAKARQITTDTLELIFNLSLEALLSENFRFFLQVILEQSYLALEKMKMGSLARTIRESMDLTDMHIYQRLEKFYGPFFGIKPFATDFVTESSTVNQMSFYPFLHTLIRKCHKFNTKELSKIYFTIQLQRITFWLHNQIALKQSFNSNDITLWFANWIKKQPLPNEEKDILEDEFADYGTIAGHRIYHMDSDNIEPLAVIAFLYEMNLLTDFDSKTTSCQEKASIRDLLENLDPVFDAKIKNFENDLNAVDTQARVPLINYLFPKKESLQVRMNKFIAPLKFNEPCNTSKQKQNQLKDFWETKAIKLKYKFDKLSPETRDNLWENLSNLTILKILNLNSKILFV